MGVWRTVGGGETGLMMDALWQRRWMTQIRVSAPHYGPSPCHKRISKHRVACFPLESLAVEGEIWGVLSRARNLQVRTFPPSSGYALRSAGSWQHLGGR